MYPMRPPKVSIRILISSLQFTHSRIKTRETDRGKNGRGNLDYGIESRTTGTIIGLVEVKKDDFKKGFAQANPKNVVTYVNCISNLRKNKDIIFSGTHTRRTVPTDVIFKSNFLSYALKELDRIIREEIDSGSSLSSGSDSDEDSVDYKIKVNDEEHSANLETELRCLTYKSIKYVCYVCLITLYSVKAHFTS
jgi:hypothetical protein